MSDRVFNGLLARVLASWLTVRPDPWPTTMDADVRSSAAVPLCTNCLAEQPPHRWFCPHCAYPSGDHVAVMPYLQVFVVGEAMRKGVMGPPEKRLGVQVFLILVSITQYSVFAPVYWYWMVRRSLGRPIGEDNHPELELDEADV